MNQNYLLSKHAHIFKHTFVYGGGPLVLHLPNNLFCHRNLETMQVKWLLLENESVFFPFQTDTMIMTMVKLINCWTAALKFISRLWFALLKRPQKECMIASGDSLNTLRRYSWCACWETATGPRSVSPWQPLPHSLSFSWCSWCSAHSQVIGKCCVPRLK